MTHRFAPLQVSLRAPLLAAAAAFLFVTVPSQVDLRLTGQRMDQAVEHLGQVHLDGLSAAVLPALRAGDAVALNEAFERAVGFDEDRRPRPSSVKRRNRPS